MSQTLITGFTEIHAALRLHPCLCSYAGISLGLHPLTQILCLSILFCIFWFTSFTAMKKPQIWITDFRLGTLQIAPSRLWTSFHWRTGAWCLCRVIVQISNQRICNHVYICIEATAWSFARLECIDKTHCTLGISKVHNQCIDTCQVWGISSSLISGSVGRLFNAAVLQHWCSERIAPRIPCRIVTTKFHQILGNFVNVNMPKQQGPTRPKAPKQWI